ncbi:hypothetical protein P1P91_00025 [Halomonas piscis]|uniref:Uncharacterized protein n=1 Tax=Halomonas piscis TaxID=3031727 RepID=A0ABY9YZW5_9GAMM|nr:hypothetical protein [Halomonas piscis]WNK20123.1 hypothetical protein P1P91_00025 [Halomonas piscis]
MSLGSRLARSSLKLLPKLLVVLVGIGLYFLITTYLEGDLKSLLVGISSTLISIPFIFIFYEIWQEKAHRKLNSSAYEFAQNQMTANIASIKEKLETFTQGAFCYFDRPGYVVNDDDIENIRIETLDAELLADVDEWEHDLLDFELANTFEAIVDARYLGFQLRDLSVEEESNDFQALLVNSFIMDRLDDDKTRVIIHLVQTVKMLQSFLSLHHDVFVRSSIRIHGLQIDEVSAGLAALVLNPGDDSETESEVLDIALVDPGQKHEELLKVFVVNPDYYTVLSDHINDVIEAMRQWKMSADPVYLDYEAGRVSGF